MVQPRRRPVSWLPYLLLLIPAIGIWAPGRPPAPDSAPLAIDLSARVDAAALRMVNRAAMVQNAPGGRTVRLSALPGEGLAWVDSVEFSTGVIELRLRVPERPESFAGVAFGGSDGDHYEAVYLHRGRVVQYASHPTYPAHTLRGLYPSRYEAPVDPIPASGDWIRLRVEVLPSTVRAYVGDGDRPDLEVRRLADDPGTKLGLWVGSESGGDFTDLRITAIHSAGEGDETSKF